MNHRLLLHLLRKEFLQISRNAFLPKLIVVFPIMMMCVMPWVMDMEVRGVRTVFVRGGGLTAILPQLCVLLGFAIIMDSWAVLSYRKRGCPQGREPGSCQGRRKEEVRNPLSSLNVIKSGWR